MKRPQCLSLVLLALVGFPPPQAGAELTAVPGGIRFTYVDPVAQTVNLAGDFNGWSISATPLTKLGDTFSLVVPLGPGTYSYRFVVDGHLRSDPANPPTGGDRSNSVLTILDDGSLHDPGAIVPPRGAPEAGPDAWPRRPPHRVRFSVSGGVTRNWTTSHDRLDKLGQADWITEGHTGRFLTVGFAHSVTGIEGSSRAWVMLTVETFDCNLQYWDRTTVGTMHATVLRLDPFVGQWARGHWAGSVNLVGLNLMRGSVDVLSGYNLYYPKGAYAYLVRQIEVESNSRGWTFLGIGLQYRFSGLPLSIGGETVMIESDNPRVIFRTAGGDFKEKPEALYGIFPVKLRVTLEL